MVEKLYIVDEYMLGQLSVLEGDKKKELLKHIHNLCYIEVPHNHARKLGNPISACILIKDIKVQGTMIKELKKYKMDMMKNDN